jgi:hypothetical protein
MATIKGMEYKMLRFMQTAEQRISNINGNETAMAMGTRVQRMNLNMMYSTRF